MALGFLPLSSAGPVRSISTVLRNRQVESYNGCTPQQEAKLGRDFADAAMFANHAAGSLTTDKHAYRNYLRDQDLGHAGGMWSAIELNNSPYNPDDGTGYKFSVRCAPADDKQDTESFAFTDAKPQDDEIARQMKICPRYFRDNMTKRSTTDKIFKPNPGRRDNSWCTPPPYRLKNFMVGGVTLLHEMTHLDVVGVAAGYPQFHDNEGGFDYHGTQDICDLKPENNPPAQARALKTLWDNGKNAEGSVEPYHSAENIAASAFEWYIISMCQYPDDMPV
ncbi:hypothetical protein F4802DRAFT_594224 [Xylaria palmicola]|nr:hypothetical protein F4802DRAFT_594224 [Xylaria palmicola]